MHRDPILCLEQGRFSPLFQGPPNTPEHASWPGRRGTGPVSHLAVPTSGVNLDAVSSKVLKGVSRSCLHPDPNTHTPSHPTHGREMNYLHFMERLLRLAVPNTAVWLAMFYLVFHLWLNILGEMLMFGDRMFYKVS